MNDNREQLLALAARLIAGGYTTDEELDRDAARFAESVPHPNALGLIFYWQDEFDHEPTPSEVVDRALTYRASEL